MTAVFTCGSDLVAAATDLLICLAAVVCALLAARRGGPAQRRRMTLLLFWLLALDGLAGFAIHGFTFFVRSWAVYNAAWTVMNILLMSLGVPLAAGLLGDTRPGTQRGRRTFLVLTVLWAMLSAVQLTGVLRTQGLIPVYVFVGMCLALTLGAVVQGVYRGRRAARWQLAAVLSGLCGGLALICIPQDWSIHILFPIDYVAVSHLFFLAFLGLYYRGFALEAPLKMQPHST